MNAEPPKLTANTLITALTYIIPGLLVFEIIYAHGYFTHFPESFTFTALLIHLLWSVALSIPFHFFRWLFLRPAKRVKTQHLPGIKALFVLLLVAIFYVFEELLFTGYLDFDLPRDDPRAYLLVATVLTGIIAFPLGIYYPKLASVIVSWRDRKAGEEA